MVFRMLRYLFSGYIFKRKKYNYLTSKKNEIKVGNKINLEKYKIVIYTVITGKYDSLETPKYINNDIDYYVVTDNDFSTSFWKKIPLPEEIKGLTKLEQARYVKTHPHLLFGEYDISIFIDGNVVPKKNIDELISLLITNQKIIGIHKHQSRDCVYDEAQAVYALGKAKYFEIHHQIKSYKNDKFPKHFGLFETNVLIRFHNNPLCIKLMEDWWNEMCRFTKRDQLSLTYVIWKNGLKCDFVQCIGTNSRNSDYFDVLTHA